jgi:hypothetical protein
MKLNEYQIKIIVACFSKKTDEEKRAEIAAIKAEEEQANDQP